MGCGHAGALATGLGAWQARLLQAELAHGQALELAGQLQQVASAPVGAQSGAGTDARAQ